MTKITTNERFDRLTNLDISTHHRNKSYWLMRSDFLGAFAYWAVAQSPYDTPDINKALCAFGEYVGNTIPAGEPVEFTYDELDRFISEDAFGAIPEVEKLNHRKNGRDGMGFCSRYGQPSPDDDFIDLGALARNVFYMILRESITQS